MEREIAMLYNALASQQVSSHIEETKSKFQEIKTIQDKSENLHVILLCKK